jgi:hypothetical protein
VRVPHVGTSLDPLRVLEAPLYRETRLGSIQVDFVPVKAAILDA